jgi:hypothetical protein
MILSVDWFNLVFITLWLFRSFYSVVIRCSYLSKEIGGIYIRFYFFFQINIAIPLCPN